MSKDLLQLMDDRKIRWIGEGLLVVIAIALPVGFVAYATDHEKLAITVLGTFLPAVFFINGFYSIIFRNSFENSGRRAISGLIFILGALFLWSVPMID